MIVNIHSNGKHALRQRYFVTGGAGFIGSNVVDALLRQGHEVYTIDDLSTGSFENLTAANRSRYHYFFEQNVLDFDWDGYLKAGDHIIHLAAAVGVDYVAKDSLFTSHNNLNVTQHVLEKCRQYRCSLLFTSTSEVYGNHDRHFSSEDDHLCMHVTHGGRSAYTLSKLYGEFLCQEYAQKYHLQITVLRLFNTIGSRQSNSFGMVVPRFIQHALRNECIAVYGAGDQTRSFCHVSDTVRAICELSKSSSSRGEIYNVGNDVSITVLELAQYIKDITNSSSEIKLSPFPEARQGDKDIKNRKPDISKILKDFGWQPEVSWQEAIFEIVESMKQQNVMKFA
ncbi:NAD-dependent epimerase/dehydratase family protein [Hymenobacter negativus]|uniref:GDP-mannose 4,6-dehydratase n=1 Tax=Hymenobacter negativus TaxID=2795026 RepID=A0ABS3QKG0_9BACT|nr:NAD-dependent epimerase/dehydratase family protein [Hymenobacter negativus]MBO2011468.1 GDP-mannose 4,6-dehydratase [Hymenobacter negativus]